MFDLCRRWGNWRYYLQYWEKTIPISPNYFPNTSDNTTNSLSFLMSLLFVVRRLRMCRNPFVLCSHWKKLVPYLFGRHFLRMSDKPLWANASLPMKIRKSFPKLMKSPCCFSFSLCYQVVSNRRRGCNHVIWYISHYSDFDVQTDCAGNCNKSSLLAGASAKLIHGNL